MKQRKWDEAAHAFYDCIRLDERDPDVWSNLAQVETHRGEWVAAKTAYINSLELGPTPDNAVDFASVLFNLNELALALHVLRQVTAQVPMFARAWERIGHVLTAHGDQAGAIAAYRRALEISPELQDARYHLEMLLLHNDRTTG